MVVLCLALAACSRDPSASSTFNPQAKADADAAKARAADERAVRAGFAPNQPQPLETVSVDPPSTDAPGTMLPAATEQYRYLGRWAATPALCRRTTWTFLTRSLSTPDGTRCDLPTVAVRPGGYELQGTCRAGNRQIPETLRVAFDEPAHTMQVGGRSLHSADLIYCGP